MVARPKTLNASLDIRPAQNGGGPLPVPAAASIHPTCRRRIRQLFPADIRLPRVFSPLFSGIHRV